MSLQANHRDLFLILRKDPEDLVLRILQDLKLENAKECMTGLEKIRQPGQKTLVLDLSHIRFIDSPGIGLILKLADMMRQDGGRLLLYGLNGSLLSVFRLAGLLKIFNIMSDADAQKDYPELIG